MSISSEERAKLRKLHADATPGPYGWEPHGDTGSYGVGLIMGEDDEPVTGCNEDPTLFVAEVAASEVNGYHNAAFYAEAYNNFPRLIDALDAEETRADKLSSQLAKALEVNAADQMEAAIKLFGGIVAAVSGEEVPQDLSVRIWLCPHCGTKHDSKEASVAHDTVCEKHPAIVRAKQAESALTTWQTLSTGLLMTVKNLVDVGAGMRNAQRQFEDNYAYEGAARSLEAEFDSILAQARVAELEKELGRKGK